MRREDRQGVGDESSLPGRGQQPRPDPESWRTFRKGRLQALTGERVGRAIESRKPALGVPTFGEIGRQHRGDRYCEVVEGPPRPRNSGTHGSFLHGNREILGLAVTGVAVRSGKPEGASR